MRGCSCAPVCLGYWNRVTFPTELKILVKTIIWVKLVIFVELCNIKRPEIKWENQPHVAGKEIDPKRICHTTPTPLPIHPKMSPNLKIP